MHFKATALQNVRYAPHSTATKMVIQGDVALDTSGKTHLVEVTRRQHGWYVHLHVTIDGVVVHDTQPSREEQDEWTKLQSRAEDALEKEYAARQRERKAVCAVLFS